MNAPGKPPAPAPSCELLIVGAGPAGMAAALAAAPSGARITLLDDNPVLGGQRREDSQRQEQNCLSHEPPIINESGYNGLCSRESRSFW